MRTVVFVYLCLVHLLLAVVLYDKYVSQPDEKDQRWLRTMNAFNARVDAQLPVSSLLFTGDSHVQGLCSGCLNTPTGNFGVGKAKIEDTVLFLTHSQAARSARAFIIQTGHNNLESPDLLAYTENVRALLSATNRHPTFWYRQFPVGITGDKDGPTVDKINQLKAEMDSIVEAQCTPQINCYFVSISRKICDDQGRLAAEYHLGDGVHLNMAAYDIWLKDISAKLGQYDLLVTEE